MYSDSVPAWILAAVGAYLLGSISGAIIASYTRHGEDIRKYGSGNAGMTNALRTYGIRNAAMVAGIDLLKTVLAILLARWLLGKVPGLIVGGSFAVLGHMLPVYYQFKGGKGVLCSAAIILMMDWRLFLCGAAVFAMAVLLTKTVSVASIAACICIPVFCLLLKETETYLLFALALALAVIVMHHANIGRIVRGEEKQTVIAKRRKP